MAKGCRNHCLFCLIIPENPSIFLLKLDELGLFKLKYIYYLSTILFWFFLDNNYMLIDIYYQKKHQIS
jgi:hypothetical protein